MFCPKCGEKNKESANFCVKCGESFDSKKTKQKSSKTKISTDEVKDVTIEATKEMTSQVSTIIKDMIAKPVDALKNYGTDENFNLSVCLIAVLSILAALFSIIVLKHTYDATLNAFENNSLYSFTNVDVKVPYAKVFLITFIYTFGLSFAYPAVLYVVNNMIFGGKASYKKMFSIFAVISIVISSTLLIAMILSVISIKLASIALVLGSALTMYYFVYMIRLVGPKDENKHSYIFVITSGIFYVLIFALIMMLS